jgi:hypothetical protein
VPGARPGGARPRKKKEGEKEREGRKGKKKRKREKEKGKGRKGEIGRGEKIGNGIRKNGKRFRKIRRIPREIRGRVFVGFFPIFRASTRFSGRR